MLKIKCTSCQHELSSESINYRCSKCGGVLDYAEQFEYDPNLIDRSKPGIWRYSDSFGLLNDVEPSSLGEGGSPLIWDDVNGSQVAFKLDYLNKNGKINNLGTWRENYDGEVFIIDLDLSQLAEGNVNFILSVRVRKNPENAHGFWFVPHIDRVAG